MRWVVCTAARIVLLSAAAMLPAAGSAAELDVRIGYVTRTEEARVPLSLLDEPVERNGIEGALLGLSDNKTTGGFLGHRYQLVEIELDESQPIDQAIEQIEAGDIQLILADLDADDLLVLADRVDDALLFNIRAADNRLRNDDCRANVMHMPPSRAMLADALAQYLAWKRWTRVVVVVGRHPEDALYAESLKRAAKRFGLRIVEEKPWTSVPGARRTDSGHHNAQQEIPAFTAFAEHDVLLVADERDEFGEYLSYRTAVPRPVGGTQGLLPSAWHRSQEQWGATQIQRRFETQAERWMTPRDYAAWAAMRSIGEAVTRTSETGATVLRHYLLSEDFKLAAFKGVPLSFRHWNGQLRQPLLLVAPRMLVSVSPQEGFLHERSELDTLGFDAPESSCQAFSDGV